MIEWCGQYRVAITTCTRIPKQFNVGYKGDDSRFCEMGVDRGNMKPLKPIIEISWAVAYYRLTLLCVTDVCKNFTGGFNKTNPFYCILNDLFFDQRYPHDDWCLFLLYYVTTCMMYEIDASSPPPNNKTLSWEFPASLRNSLRWTCSQVVVITSINTFPSEDLIR